jgi:hypothetical protein
MCLKINQFIYLLFIFLFLIKRLHYNLRYALNLFENRWTIVPISEVSHQSLSQQQSAAPSLTHEQTRIVNHRIERHHVSCVIKSSDFHKIPSYRIYFICVLVDQDCGVRWKRENYYFASLY